MGKLPCASPAPLPGQPGPLCRGGASAGTNLKRIDVARPAAWMAPERLSKLGGEGGKKAVAAAPALWRRPGPVSGVVAECPARGLLAAVADVTAPERSKSNPVLGVLRGTARTDVCQVEPPPPRRAAALTVSVLGRPCGIRVIKAFMTSRPRTRCESAPAPGRRLAQRRIRLGGDRPRLALCGESQHGVAARPIADPGGQPAGLLGLPPEIRRGPLPGRLRHAPLPAISICWSWRNSVAYEPLPFRTAYDQAKPRVMLVPVQPSVQPRPARRAHA